MFLKEFLAILHAAKPFFEFDRNFRKVNENYLSFIESIKSLQTDGMDMANSLNLCSSSIYP